MVLILTCYLKDKTKGLYNVVKKQAQQKCLTLNYETGLYHETFGKKDIFHLPICTSFKKASVFRLIQDAET